MNNSESTKNVLISMKPTSYTKIKKYCSDNDESFSSLLRRSALEKIRKHEVDKNEEGSNRAISG